MQYRRGAKLTGYNAGVPKVLMFSSVEASLALKLLVLRRHVYICHSGADIGRFRSTSQRVNIPPSMRRVRILTQLNLAQ